MTEAVSTWEAPIAALLVDLSAAQQELLAVLAEKRKFITAGDGRGLKALQPREEQLAGRLVECHQRRQQLLSEAQAAGLPSGSVTALTGALPLRERKKLKPSVEAARHQARMLQHHSLANWVLVQRSLLHLSQLIEIIATGGQMQPTYGVGSRAAQGGVLVDQEA
jgi:hypothetical protein